MTIKRTRSWINKKGELITRTYIYDVLKETRVTKSGKKTKKTYKRHSSLNQSNFLVMEGEELSENIDAYMSGIKDQSIKNSIEREISKAIKNKKSLNIANLEKDLIERPPISKQAQLMYNLGYSEEEFKKEFGYSEEDLINGKFEEIENGKLKFTFKDKEGKNKITYFVWDYNAGLVRV